MLLFLKQALKCIHPCVKRNVTIGCPKKSVPVLRSWGLFYCFIRFGTKIFFNSSMLRISSKTFAKGATAFARPTLTASKASTVWRRNLNVEKDEPVVIYNGPLANVAKKLKLFSITSLGLGTGISPFVFAIDVPVPFVAKAALVGAGKRIKKTCVHEIY